MLLLFVVVVVVVVLLVLVLDLVVVAVVGVVIVGADMGFVVAHHLFRIFIIILGAPILARFMRAKPLH